MLLRAQVVIFDLMLLHSASNVITNTPRHVLFSSESEPLPSPSALCPCLATKAPHECPLCSRRSVAVISLRS